MDYFKRIVDFFTGGRFSEPGIRAFYEWLSDEEYSEEKDRTLKAFWDQADYKADAKTRKSWRTFRRKAGMQDKAPRIQRLRIWQSVAAVLLVISLSAIYTAYKFQKNSPSPDLIEQYVPIAEITHLTLPDGTQVQMNSTATLFYPEQFTGETRSVYLIGEANFKVAKNEKQPFIVKSNDFQVTALGTEFNMQAYPGDPILSATLLSGSVEVRFNNMTTARILKPNEQLIYNKQTKEKTISYPDINDVTAWQRGELVFRSVTLKEIFTVLERKYPYSFVYALNSLKDDRYMFRFKDKDSIEEVMDIIIEVSGNIRYSITGDKCYISPL